MHTRRAPILVLAAVALIGLVDACHTMPRKRALAAPCRIPDSETMSHLHYLRASASGTGPVDAGWRGTAIPFITDTVGLITVVSDSATCARAVASYDRLMNMRDTGITEIEVLRAGTVFVISHPRIRRGEWVGRFVVDSRMRFINSYLY
jgi:hypothetical protein